MSSKEQLIEGLTPQQQKAVLWPAEGKLRIAAGAGSGKTEVLTRRIAAIIDSGIKPHELVALTYTQKAAAEMKSRLVDKKRIQPWQLRDMEVSTFHAFLSRFLKQDPFGAGLDRSVSVIAENNRQLIMVELIEKFAEVFGEQIIYGPEALGAGAAMKLINEFPQALGRIRRYLLKPAEFYNLSRDLFKHRENDTTQLERNSLEWLYRFYTCYLEELEKLGLLDFDEILIRGRNLVKEIRDGGGLPDRRIFLIDEFQDNNADQLELVNLFCRKRESHITVVGDEKQSIYRFQGANVETFRNFPSNEDIILADNFRSYAEIIAVADRFLEMGGDTGKMFARQTAHRGSSPRKPVVTCFLSPESEAPQQTCDQLAEMILSLAGSGMMITDRKAGGERALRFGDIAIIVSSIKGLPASFEDALSIRQIPYVMSGGFSFYARSEIEEILAFLRLLAQPNDDHSVVKILSGPLYGLQDSELTHMANAGRMDGVGLLAHILAQSEENLPEKAQLFRELFVQIKERSTKPGLLDLCHTILEQAGFYEFAASQKSELKRRRMENNLGKFLGIVRNFEQSGIFTSLRDFLSYIERMLMSDIDEDEAGLGLEEGDAIKIMTIHKSKGLEFPVVICPFLKKRHYKAGSRIYFDRNCGLMVNDPALPGRKGASHLLLEHIETDRHASELEDRRKLYVAFTRAEDLLVITGLEKHSLSADAEAESDKTPEPLIELRSILEASPELGTVKQLEDWPLILQEWLNYGSSASHEIKSIEPVPADIDMLSDSLRQIAAFLNRTSAAEVSPQHEQEIYSLQDIALFKACPRRYFFTSRHVSSFTDRKTGFSGTVGTMVHETIRLYHTAEGHKHPEKDTNVHLAHEILDTLVPFYSEDGKQALPVARRIVENYARSELGLTEPWMVEAEVNVKFASLARPFFVRGFADRVDRLDGITRIIDFKTRNYSAAAHMQYKNQLALYRIAANRGVLADAGCLDFAMSYIAYLSFDDIKIVEIEPDLQSFEEEITRVIQEIRSESLWQPRSGELCHDCGYAVLCHGALSPT